MDPTCMECVKKGFAGYSDYSSRSRRKEYWYFALVMIIYNVILTGISSVLNKISIIPVIISILIFIPSILFELPLAVRRLHDTGKSGWWMLLCLTGIGAIVILIFCCLDSDPQNNEYGPSPKYGNQGQGLTES